jgi:uncharacterized C2H2 Zn-finger protein
MLRDSFATCPRCDRALDAGDTCGQCHGALVADRVLYDQISDAQLQELLTTKRKTPWRREEFATALVLAESRDGTASISCPRCESQMHKYTLYDVEVDYCPAHGVWLDGDNEIRQVLRNAAERI